MLVLKSNTPVSFDIGYNISNEDSKNAVNIEAAKFFLATSPGEADNKYLLKTYPSGGLTYDDQTGNWTVTIGQGDLDNINPDFLFRGVLAIRYTGDTDYREPDLFEGTEPLLIRVEAHYSD